MSGNIERPDPGIGADDEDLLAAVRDDLAKTADVIAAKRDSAADDRDALSEAYDDVAPPDALKKRAAHDRRAAADDRAHSLDDRGRARRDRKTSAHARRQAAEDRTDATAAVAALRDLLVEAEDHTEAMVLIGQAQGQLMERHGYSAFEAVCHVALRAEHEHSNLHEAARRITEAGRDA